MFMEIRTDDVWRLSHQCMDASNFDKDQSEPMVIVWKLIGDRLGGIFKSMKKSSTILPGQASGTLSRTYLDWWRPPAEDLTPWMNSLTRLWPLKLHMSKTRCQSSRNNNRSSNSSSNSLRTRLPKAASEGTGHPSLSQPTPPAVPNPANRDQTDTAIQAAEDNCQAYHHHHGSQRISSNANDLPANAYDADLRTKRRASALYTHDEVMHRNSRTRHLPQTGMEDTKSNNRSPSTINNHKTNRPLSGSGPMGEVRRGGIGVRVVSNSDYDGDDGQHTTASDCFEVKGVVGEPKRSHVKSVIMWHVQTGHIPYYSQCLG